MQLQASLPDHVQGSLFNLISIVLKPHLKIKRVEIIILFRISTHVITELLSHLTLFPMLSDRKDSLNPTSRIICSCLKATVVHLTDALMVGCYKVSDLCIIEF